MIWTITTLEQKGYDGLYSPILGCACTVRDLRPCGQSISDTLTCKPGYEWPDDDDILISSRRYPPPGPDPDPDQYDNHSPACGIKSGGE